MKVSHKNELWEGVRGRLNPPNYFDKVDGFLIGFGDPPAAYFGYNFVIFCDLGWRAGGKFPGPLFWCSGDGNDARMQ